MIKIKFCSDKKKGGSIVKYSVNLEKKNVKANYFKELELGRCTPKIKFYMFRHVKVIAYSKLGASLSKRFPLKSLFYLKDFLAKNMF